jgi:hypothetical protein
VRLSGKSLDDLNDFISLISLCATKVDQFPHPLHYRTLLGSTRDGDPTPTTELNEALVSENVFCPEHSVLVDPEDGGDVLGQRETLSWPSFSIRNGTADLCRHLVMEGDGF